MLFRVNMISHCSWPKKSVEIEIASLDLVNRIKHEIDFSQLCVNTDTSVHNLSFSTQKYRPGTLVLVKQAFIIANKAKSSNRENCSDK